jgi:flavin reductase (DIM6/NTAB) family NADH-FMN oxidoreductase RutF
MNDARPSALPMLSFNPAECQQRQIYKLMTGMIVPRPIALVSTMSRDGAANLAPFSFFCGVGSAPPTVLFCPALRPADSTRAGERKDTLRNVEETGEFVISVVSEAIAAAANAASADAPPEVDEFTLSGLTPVVSEVVRPPRVAESPAQMECKLLQVIYAGKAPASCSASTRARIWSRTSASIRPAWTPSAAWQATPGSVPASVSNWSGQSERTENWGQRFRKLCISSFCKGAFPQNLPKNQNLSTFDFQPVPVPPCPILSPCRGPHGQVFVRGVVRRKGGKPRPPTGLLNRFLDRF